MKNSNSINKLLKTIQALRGPKGCPWDRRQTPSTMVKYLVSETDELVAAISDEDTENICEELGDLLYLVIIISEMFSESQTFTLDTVIENITEKLIRRHPHVFSDLPCGSEAELVAQWERIKAEEKKKNTI